jgi:hypothetical protein
MQKVTFQLGTSEKEIELEGELDRTEKRETRAKKKGKDKEIAVDCEVVKESCGERD